MKKSLITASLFILISCKNNEVKFQSQQLFGKASAVVKRNPENSDSLEYAITLIDSAINYDKKNLTFYLTESRIFLNLKQYDKAIAACNSALLIDNKDFFALLNKAVSFDKMNDSIHSQKIYQEALKSLEQTKFKTPIFKDYQRIVIYSLLNDSAKFQMKLNEFKAIYRNNSNFLAYDEELINFKKQDYLNSY